MSVSDNGAADAIEDCDDGFTISNVGDAMEAMEDMKGIIREMNQHLTLTEQKLAQTKMNWLLRR